MKKQALLFAVALSLGGAIVIGTGAPNPDLVTAAKGGTPGPPSDDGGDVEVPDYGDLVIILRDNGGVPVPSDPVDVPDPETGLTVPGGYCWQPIATGDFPEDWNPPTERVVLPTGYDAVTGDDGDWLIPVDQYTCAVEAEFATYMQEVDFGRINEARSPASVFDAQLADAVTKLATADTTSLDPAGRMVASTCYLDDDAEVVTTSSTIDSPLQNLAIYRQLMLMGPDDQPGTIGSLLPPGADWLDTAARALGAASDKSGGVNVDMVAYLNAIMGLDAMDLDTFLPKTCVTLREEVQGVIMEVEHCFINFGESGAYAGYAYDRTANFAEGTGALPAPPYIPENEPRAGWFEYSRQLDATTFEVVQGPILEPVFGEDVGFQDGNIGGFAQASDDTRAVIDFMHTYPVIGDTATPLSCTPSGGVFVDVSISERSGLQVPKNVVDGSSDREFIVTVANAGPAVASGTVEVTATAYTGTEDEVLIQDPWTFDFDNLGPGASVSIPQVFAVDLGERATIDWTATAVSDQMDVNPANNEVSAVSNVIVTGGGGRP